MNLRSKTKFSLNNVSIEKKLTLYIFLLLFIVIGSLTTVSYIGVRNASMQVGEERLKALTDQFAGLFAASTQKTITPLKKAAEAKITIDYLSTSAISDKEIEYSLTDAFEGDTLIRSVELWSPEEKLILTTNKAFATSQYGIVDTLFDMALEHGDVIVGKIHYIRDSMFYPMVITVKQNDLLLGYMVRWRLIQSTEKAIKQITGLLGENTSLYIGNEDGSLWTNLLTVQPAPVNGIIRPGYIEYKGAYGDVMAGVHKFGGTPWLFIIELSKSALLETAKRFLQWAVIAGIGILFIGILLSRILSRQITNPLNELTTAASEIARGNYNTSVRLNRDDELGKLSESFNTMVTKVKGSKQELEQKVQDRTLQLQSANKELEELNYKLKEIDEIKTNFFTNISHELRTPLALILGPVERMLSDSQLSTADIKDLHVVQQNARILLKHVNNLLDLSKLEVGKVNLNYSEFDFAELVKISASYFESLAVEENIIINIKAPPSLMICADFGKLERVLINLFSNAFKFTPAGGRIDCKFYLTDGGSVQFEIKDSGPGIQLEFINKIFERYSGGFGNMNRNIGSSGLGLSIVKEFIDMHGGSITGYNSEEGGAVFSFSIPVKVNDDEIVIDKYKAYSYTDLSLDKELARKPISKNQFPPESAEHKQGAPSILIIEDNIEMNRFIFGILNKDYNIITAFDGEEGLQKAKMYNPDLIISDIMMPKLSGEMLMEKLLNDNELSTTPVIFLTAKANEQLKVDLLKKGAYDYLHKPFSIKELIARVANILMIKSTKDRLQKELQSNSSDISELADELITRKQLVEESLSEKRILLQEIHHRVKNNLQIISSLLNLQSDFIEDQTAIKSLLETQNRIRSMALVHEQLYNMQSLSKIEMNKYIHELMEHLLRIYKSIHKNISTSIHVHNIYISIDIAICVGLILNELVTNAVKYAFNGKSAGEIFISFCKLKDQYRLIVKDNGKGIDKEVVLKEESTLGLLIVKSLTAQLGGHFNVENSQGTEFIIDFPEVYKQ